MKKILFLLIFACLNTVMSAQFVTISDTNFRNFLQANFPSAMNGNQMDTTNAQITSVSVLAVDSLFITDLNGLQYFNNLFLLDCTNNLLTSLPNLPNGLSILKCSTNQLGSLPTLPSSLTELNCSYNQLNTLPALPSSLAILNCSYNHISVLDPYAASLWNVNCSNNQLDSLPAFTNTIKTFNASYNQLGSIPALTNSVKSLDVSYNALFNLPVLNNTLDTLICTNDSLSALPVLVDSLAFLNCSGNQLNLLPVLTPGLKYLDCSRNLLDSLPVLPGALIHLACNHNALNNLPTLPLTLDGLFCSYNSIDSLINLPPNLKSLDYSGNPVAMFPSLPSSLSNLWWENNPTNILPILPPALIGLFAANNILDSLPTLPNTLQNLNCTNDSLFNLPTLPSALSILNCSGNYLSTLPQMPSGLQYLYCNNNQINQLPDLPTTINTLNCEYNSSLHCLPVLPTSMYGVQLYGTAITCMPNYVQFNEESYSSFASSLPLCSGSSPCPHAWNIAGGVHADTSMNCILDSLNPGNQLRNLKVQLYQGPALIDSFRITSYGMYSFRAPLNMTYGVKVNTVGLPFTITCPGSIIHTVTPTTLDSMKDHLDFGIICNGLDAGIKSISGRFRPDTTSYIVIRGGDMAMYYNLNCSANQQAQVTTTLNGPITYVQPAPGAITPSNVSNNVITYLIPDLGAVDFNSAFSIQVMTDAMATIGDQVCVNTTISGITGDMNLSNNSKTSCFGVVNSFDPNSKEVTPVQGSKGGDELTYTIHFQNTGNDTAYRVVLIDTLSKQLDWNSLQLQDASHDVDIVRSGAVVKFIFEDILLTAKSQNEPLSMGWVKFTIRLKDDLPLYTKTRNRAFIYFDQNTPIITNYADNYIGIDTGLLVVKHPVMVPEAFSPNGDMLNDTWHIINKEYLDYKKVQVEKVIVRNRWGQVVFSGSGTDWKWMGEENATGSVYSYQIFYNINGAMDNVQNGTIVMFTERP